MKKMFEELREMREMYKNNLMSEKSMFQEFFMKMMANQVDNRNFQTQQVPVSDIYSKANVQNYQS